ncbi:hypothetical protein Dimus_038782 [Dionaea muscipula]
MSRVEPSIPMLGSSSLNFYRDKPSSSSIRIFSGLDQAWLGSFNNYSSSARLNSYHNSSRVRVMSRAEQKLSLNSLFFNSKLKLNIRISQQRIRLNNKGSNFTRGLEKPILEKQRRESLELEVTNEKR